MDEAIWRPYFPKPIPRPQQVSAISQILSFLDFNPKHKQYVLLNAPTGAGKSAIAITLALFNQSKKRETNYLVHNKHLETQITTDYPFASETKGRNNF